MGGSPARLSNHPLFQTTDLDEARVEVARVFCPHRLDLAERGGRLDTLHNSASLDKVSVNYLDYGAAVHIEPGELESLFVVQIPIAGRSRVRCGQQEIVSTPALASVPTPTEHLDMHWDGGDPKLILKVERSVLENLLQRMIGHALPRPIRFRLGMELWSGPARGWLELVWLLVSELERGDGLVRQPTAVAHLEEALLASLLLFQSHNFSRELHRRHSAPHPKVIQQAVDLIEAYPERALTTEEIARSVLVSVRTLQEGFQRHVGRSPMAYLRDVRLTRVRDELLAGQFGRKTVTETALDWGFFHLGRFAAAYRAKFGESPSQTLRGPRRPDS